MARRVLILDHPILTTRTGVVVDKSLGYLVVELDHYCGVVLVYPHEVADDTLPQWIPEWLRRWVYRYRGGRHHVHA